MKYFKGIEILYENIFIISKYFPLSNNNVNTVITDMNNVESSTNSDCSNEIYNITVITIEIILLITSRISDKICLGLVLYKGCYSDRLVRPMPLKERTIISFR